MSLMDKVGDWMLGKALTPDKPDRPSIYHGLGPVTMWQHQAAPPQPTDSGECIHTVDTEILAWRGWRFDPKSELEPILMSVGHPVRWEGPVLTADSPPSTIKGRFGMLEHANGIYALKSFPEPESVDAHYFSFGAYGQVALSGLVVEGERGYRAERAVIRSLHVGRSEMFGPMGDRFCAWEIAGMMEHRYGVDVQVAQVDWSDWVQRMKYADSLRAITNRYR